MTVPDTPEIMEHIMSMIFDARREYSLAVGECEKAITEKDDAQWVVANGRCEKWRGYMDALSELKCWILTPEKDG